MDIDDKPTTENGPLHDPRTTLADRRIVAFYESAGDAEQARATLIQAGVEEVRINVTADAKDDKEIAASAQAPDRSLVSMVRDAIVPDETTKLPREAIRGGQAILAVEPRQEDADRIVEIIENTQPRHFDAQLERWRNSG